MQIEVELPFLRHIALSANAAHEIHRAGNMVDSGRRLSGKHDPGAVFGLLDFRSPDDGGPCLKQEGQEQQFEHFTWLLLRNVFP